MPQVGLRPLDEVECHPMKYRRIVVKLSGEALLGEGQHGIDPMAVQRIASEMRDVCNLGVELALVIGGGNIFRGAGLAKVGIDRVTGDHMGMLATVMNALAMQDALEGLGLRARVMSALSVRPLCEDYARRRALHHLQQGRIVLFAAGTGNPLFTTDSAASLRAIEIGADLLVKATKVDGVYSADPMVAPDAVFYPRVSYDDVLARRLGVMDEAAVVLCRAHGLAVRVMNVAQGGALMRLLTGEDVGSLMDAG